MGARNAIAIDWGRRRLRAVLAAAGRGGVKVRRVLVEDVPAGLDVQDAAAFGGWIAEQLRQARIPSCRATIALGREHVGLKRIVLPTAEAAELADMTRLAMQRELPFAADSAVIDFVAAERTAISTTVLAVAVPQAAIDHARAVAQAAGLTIERISLRAMGAAALLNSFDALSLVPGTEREALAAPDTPGKATPTEAAASGGIAVDVTGDGVEFCIVADGHVRFSRAAEVPQPQDQLAIADAVVTETRRTWMSYRIVEPSTPIGHALLMGDRRVSAYASKPVSEMLKIPVQVLESHPKLDAGGNDLDRVWPLVGLLLEPLGGRESIDFNNPRKAPDVGARTRQRRLIAAGLIVVACLGAWTYFKRDRQALERQLEGLNEQASKGLPDYMRYVRDTYKLEHLKNWEAVGVDWLKHATYVSAIAPPPDRVVLDAWTGTLEFGGVRFDRKTGRWSTDESLTIVIDGEAKDRETADAFRGALVSQSIYTTTTTGGDSKGGKRMPFGFTYRLHTRESPPVPAPAPSEPAPAAVTAAHPADAIARAEGAHP